MRGIDAEVTICRADTIRESDGSDIGVFMAHQLGQRSIGTRFGVTDSFISSCFPIVG